MLSDRHELDKFLWAWQQKRASLILQQVYLCSLIFTCRQHGLLLGTLDAEHFALVVLGR